LFAWIKKYLAKNDSANESKSAEHTELVTKGGPLIAGKQPSLPPNSQPSDKPSYNTSGEHKEKLSDALRILANAENGLLFDADMPISLTAKDCHSKAKKIIIKCLIAIRKTSKEKFDRDITGENGHYINIYHEMGPGFMRVEDLLRNFEPKTHKTTAALKAFYALTLADKNNGPVKIGDHLGAGAGAMMDFCNALQKIIDKNDYNEQLK